MTDQQVLERVIQRAIEGGWKPIWVGDFKGVSFNLITGEPVAVYQYPGIKSVYHYSILAIIFNQDFAKALFGEEDCFIYVEYASENIDAINSYPQGAIHMPFYQFHLQQMVISPDPVQYLRTWLEENDKEQQ